MSGSTTVTVAGATGFFRIENGQILDPNGNIFTVKGINLSPQAMSAADQILAEFPGLNFIRLNIFDYEPPATYAAFIDKMTSHGVVVELEDHTASDGTAHGGSSGSAFTGTQLANELNWYSSVARAYASNPFVWFGTNNEPPHEGLSPWHRQTYDAIRSTGNNNPILVSMPGGGWIGEHNVESYGMDPAAYATMSNIIMDVHLYGWSSGFAPDQQAVNTALTNFVKGAQTVPSASGKVPVIIGEFGPSTDSHTIDANADLVVQAAQNSSVTHGTAGAVAFTWAGGNLDSLTDGQGNFTSYGQEVANWIARDPLSPAIGATGDVVSQDAISIVATPDTAISFINDPGDATEGSAGAGDGSDNTEGFPAAANEPDTFDGDNGDTGIALDLPTDLTAFDLSDTVPTLPDFSTETDSSDGAAASFAVGGGPETAIILVVDPAT